MGSETDQRQWSRETRRNDPGAGQAQGHKGKPMDTGDMRTLARSIRDGRSEATTAEYERAWLRLNGEPWRAYADRKRVSKRYAYLLKAAERYGRAGNLLGWLSLSDKARKTGDKDSARRYRKTAEALARRLLTTAEPYRPEAPKKSRKTSKRQSLARLPNDWREQLIGALKEGDRLPAVVLALTGCRPAEYQAGILFERNGTELVATIFGAKVSTFTGGGQAQRQLTFDDSDPLARWLLNHPAWQHDRLGAGGDLGAWRKRFTRTAARLGFKKISPYSMRHQFSGDQKARGWNDDRLSQALGHTSARMRQHYGHSEQGRGGGGRGLKSVTATSPVRNPSGPLPTPTPAPAPAPVADLGMDMDFDDFEPGPGPG